MVIKSNGKTIYPSCNYCNRGKCILNNAECSYSNRKCVMSRREYLNSFSVSSTSKSDSPKSKKDKKQKQANTRKRSKITIETKQDKKLFQEAICVYCDSHFLICHNKKCSYFLTECRHEMGMTCKKFISRRHYNLYISSAETDTKTGKSRLKVTQKTDWRKADQTYIIHIYSGVSRCQTMRHSRIDYNVIIEDIFGNNATIKVFYCEDCNKYYVAENSLPERYHLFKHVSFIQEDEPISIYDTWEPKSILTTHGYNVRQNGPNARRRHEILMELIEAQTLSYADIISHINGIITLHEHEGKWHNAILKYKEDLEFLNKQKDNVKTINGIII